MRRTSNASSRPVASQRGFTLIELLVTTTISVLVVAGLGGVLRAAVESKAVLAERIEITRDASFAMQRLVQVVSHSPRLILPLADNDSTNWPEHVREQTVPPSPPVGSSTLATAVLAVALPAYVDLDFDGFPDADNDRDGRIDEDPGADVTFDNAGGIYLVDDDGDGGIDEASFGADDDEHGLIADEDPLNGDDDDGDGSVDEDPPADSNDDGCPGICAVDDDGDGQIDEGSAEDDDEDGVANEDWHDTVVFYLDDGVLQERLPVPWDESGGGLVSGLDFVTSDLAERVTRLRFERLQPSGSGAQLVDITLELTGPSGQSVSLSRRARVGAAL